MVGCLRWDPRGVGYGLLWKQGSYAYNRQVLGSYWEGFLPPQSQASAHCHQKPWPPHAFKEIIHPVLQPPVECQQKRRGAWG